MDTLRALTAFVRSAELGSLTAAARALATTQPTVSKLVTALEAQVGARLLERTTTRVAPTQEGARFLARAKRVLEDYDEAVADLHDQARQPRGVLRVAAPVALGQLRLNALMMEFTARYPEIELELKLDDRFTDPVEERMDVTLRLGGALPLDMVARPLVTWPRYLVASPDYLARRGRPRTLDDLAGHDYLRYALGGDDGLTLHGRDGTVTVPVKSRYRVNNAVNLLATVMRGGGISLQPTWMVRALLRQKLLVRVLPAWSGPPQIAHLIYASPGRLPLRTKVMVDFLAQRVPKF